MSYWAKRMAKSQDTISQKRIEEIEKQLARYYARTMKQVILDFEATYDKLCAAALDNKQPTPADLYRLDRYWKLQGQLRAQLEKLGEKQIALLSEQFESQWFSIYDSISLPSGKAYSTVSKESVQQMINQIWCADGKSWSKRIWENTEKLRETLNEELIHCVATGKKTTELKHLLQERFNVSYSRADVLVRTEVAHIQTQAAQQRYIDYGIKEVEVWADKDERRCEKCGKLHQKRYPVNGAMPVPVHSRCRCCIVPVIE